MPNSMKGKQNTVASVSYQGVRYEAVEKPALRNLDPSCGFIVAFNESDDMEKWVLKIYESDMPTDIEDHKRNVRISKMKLKGFFKKKLLVVNERGRQFQVNLDTMLVTES